MPEKNRIKDRILLGGHLSNISTEDFLKIIPSVRDQMMIALQKKIAQLTLENKNLANRIQELEKCEEFSIKDPLTEAFNRRFLNETGHKIVASEKRAQRSWGVIFVDIDHFKITNDTYGHQCGDAVLKNVTRMLQHISREGDFVVRYGGDEFIILVLDISENDIRNLAERYRKAVCATNTIYDTFNVSVTSSIGVCFVPSDSSMDLDQVIGYADKGLYRAKDSGRNQVRFFCDRRKDTSEKGGDDRREIDNE